MSKRNRYRAFREKNKRDRTTAHAEWAGKPLEFWGEMARAYNPTLDDETAAKVGDALRGFWLRWTAPTDGRVPYSVCVAGEAASETSAPNHKGEA